MPTSVPTDAPATSPAVAPAVAPASPPPPTPAPSTATSTSIAHLKPSLHVKKSYTYYLEQLFDLAFLASVLVTPLAVGLAGYWLWMGWLWWAALALIVAACAAVAFYGRYIAPWQLQETQLMFHDGQLNVSSVTTRPPTPTAASGTRDKLRVVFFSDLHLARIKKRAWVQRVVDATNRHQPDVVLIGGDFVGILGDHTFEELLAPLKDLHAPLGIYAVLGNHDYGLPGVNHAQDIERALHSVGARLLRNDALNLDPHVQLITVDELWGDLDNIDQAFAMADVCIAETGRQTQRRRIFLGHNPDLMLKMKPEQHADLFIFGHTHHGQIYLPFWPSLAVPIHSHFYRGTYTTDHGPVYVSSGAGDANSPIRILTWPEIVIFDV